ncbi:hypothetical protein [Cerasicoccus fimbriatus]|uniref:hypothetical protein n=1 Tax=Cerasicoccus fimbriatus TaxID=3014554 RepID=UPI0022B2B16D|nr:hypothetical protein [Cerasicoccus sp. TK19100]
MKTSLRSILLLLILAIAPGLAHAEEAVQMEVILVLASNTGQGVDPALQPYAANLERLFRFNTYQQRDKKTMTISVPGARNVNLYGGTDLQLGLQAVSDGKLPVNLDWRRGKEKLLRTMIRLNANTPTIIGGPQGPNNTGTYLLIIQSRM